MDPEIEAAAKLAREQTEHMNAMMKKMGLDDVDLTKESGSSDDGDKSADEFEKQLGLEMKQDEEKTDEQHLA